MVKSNIMEFDLTPEITDEIIFAMEDQTGRFLFDSSECRCVPSKILDASERNVNKGDEEDDTDLYYSIPVWDSISGFKMMDRFISQLRNPIVREELRSALAYGHGVFRNFKNILKRHPEVERLWYQFKEREMKNTVLEWYNSLRDFWGLDRIGAEPEETSEIVSHDFLFREYTDADEELFESLYGSITDEIEASMPPELSDSISDLWVRINENAIDDEGPVSECLLVVESPEGDIVAYSSSSPIPSSSLSTVQLTLLAVSPEFRGLGIGKELLARTISHWAGKGYRWLLFTSPIVPAIFFPVLHRSGFVEKGHVSVLDLSNAHCH